MRFVTNFRNAKNDDISTCLIQDFLNLSVEDYSLITFISLPVDQLV